MKRFIVSILAILYMASSSGAVVHLHYCMGRLIEASIGDNGKDNHDCSHCGMKKKSNGGCCKDEQKVFKVDNAHQQSAKILFEPAKIFNALTSPLSPRESAPVYTFRDYIVIASNGPPLIWRTLPIYIQIQNFRI